MSVFFSISHTSFEFLDSPRLSELNLTSLLADSLLSFNHPNIHTNENIPVHTYLSNCNHKFLICLKKPAPVFFFNSYPSFEFLDSPRMSRMDRSARSVSQPRGKRDSSVSSAYGQNGGAGGTNKTKQKIILSAREIP